MGVAFAFELHVSPDGAPDAPGTRDAPLDSLERARDMLRERAAEDVGPATVWIHEGDYFLSQSFRLTAEDSGTPEAPVTYRAWPDATVRLIGGRVVSPWERVNDPAVLERIPASAHAHVRVADLGAQGIADYGTLKSRGFSRDQFEPAGLELFYNDVAMTLARWPNDEFVRIAGYPEEHEIRSPHGIRMGDLEHGFYYDDERPAHWQEPEKVWMHGYWMWDWADSHERIERIDLDTKLIHTAPPHGSYGFRPGQRYYYSNILEELDEPGEWYLDRENGMLYFWPPGPIEEAEVIVSTMDGALVTFLDCAHVTLSGVQLRAGRGVGVGVENGSHIRVTECDIRNSGTVGIRIHEGTDHTVDHCRIAHTGEMAIAVRGGDLETMRPGRHQIIANHLHHMGRWSRCYRPGVLLHGVGHRVANNLIHDGPHSAISFGGRDHVIELNEIHSVCTETGDVGAIYTGRDWTARGNVIRYNYIHRLGGVAGHHGSMAIYLDDMASGFHVYGNVMYRGQHGVYVGGGRDNIVDNNVFIEMSRHPIHVDARGASSGNNWRQMIRGIIKTRLYDAIEKSPEFVERYPDLLKIRDYYEEHDAFVPPEGTALLRNMIVGSGGINLNDGLDESDILRVENNLVTDEPQFVDPSRGDFRLRPDSQAQQIGFEPIPMDTIGLPKRVTP